MKNTNKQDNQEKLEELLGKNLPLKMVGVIFAMLTATAGITFGISTIIYRNSDFFSQGRLTLFLIIALGISTAVGTLLSGLISNIVLRSSARFVMALQQVANGDFSAKLPLVKNGRRNALAENFNAMVAKLSDKETLREDFVTNFSHEFKTPIVSVAGFATLLKNTDLPAAEREEYLNIIIDESNRLVNLSENVLALSRLENQQSQGEKTEFRLDEQLRQAVLLFDKPCSEKNITVTLDLEEITCKENFQLVQQLWVNLISNAVKFTPHSGEIEVSARKTEKGITVSVRDSGCGMDEYTKERVFNKFFQGDLSHATPGNGLGLAIVKRIVEIIGGEIDVKSEVQKGSEFTVYLKG